MYGNIELDESQGRKLDVQEWSCDCINPKHRINKFGNWIELNYGKYQRTKVTKDGICVYCGHYAYKIEVQILDAERSVKHRVIRRK